MVLTHHTLLFFGDIYHILQRKSNRHIEILDGCKVHTLLLGQQFDHKRGHFSLPEQGDQILTIFLLFFMVMLGSDEFIDLLTQSAHGLLAIGYELDKGRGNLHTLLSLRQLILIEIKIHGNNLSVYSIYNEGS